MSTEKKQRNPSLSTDAIVIRKSDDNKNEILLIERKNNPFKGKLAFPGGFVDNGEDPGIFNY
jgi:8-oxo-dGTP diphosphatase